MVKTAKPFLKEISTFDAAEKYNLSPSYIARLARTAQVQGRKVGRDWIINEESLHKYLEGPRRPGPKSGTVIPNAQERFNLSPDKSHLLEILAHAWATQHKVRLIYAPLWDDKPTEYHFAPYLLISSHTIGYSVPPNSLRTFKLDRISYIELTEETFQIPEDFDASALLSSAWGVITDGEKPIEVRLRFSLRVASRVKEALWHPTQKLEDMPNGEAIWSAQIENLAELEKWVRSWGADCEVVAPQELREKMVKEISQLAHIYDITDENVIQPR